VLALLSSRAADKSCEDQRALQWLPLADLRVSLAEPQPEDFKLLFREASRPERVEVVASLPIDRSLSDH
jgi:hypothetical protein